MKYRCPTCDYVFDDAAGIPHWGIPPGTRWERLPGHWVCPGCRARKINFVPAQSVFSPSSRTDASKQMKIAIEDTTHREDTYEMSYGALSALCSSLANSCERQFLSREAGQFAVLAEYYETHAQAPADASVDRLLTLAERDLSDAFARADAAADAAEDRGAKRILKWNRGVTRASNSLLSRYKSQGDKLLQNKSVYICEVCGYIHIGDTSPPFCPVCRAHDFKFSKVVKK